MRPSQRRSLWVLLVVPAITLAAVAQTPQPASSEAVSAKTWIGHAEEIAEYLKTAAVVSMRDIGTGVTNPKRAELAPGGPVAEIAWKPIRSGYYRGHYESYQAEIAAYELDRLLGLNMVPVTVEKRIEGALGAASMWVSPANSFKELGGPPTPPPSLMGKWNYQLIGAKMFDNLIYNRDPNLGNWLVDPAWNLILIDHSRAFTTRKNMVHAMTRVDRELWDRMKQLDEATLTEALGEWLSAGQIRAILERRGQMEQEIQKLVEERGEAAVFVRFLGVNDDEPTTGAPKSLAESCPGV